MTITMTEKHQVTIPKKVAEILGLKKGSMFNVAIKNDCIQLVPLEVKKRALTREEYKKFDKLVLLERGKEKLVTKHFIRRLKQGK